ncbi:type II toxin-antitoxin system RelE/ParE family toxin [Aggregatibacter actinomycetemcomitans]|uniref:type II toxin-antitoxin system RelE family toxin n=1 Tax=Aggregatibacter actinomycetemcomitans TaxID=714 RepID=UPI0011E07D70|nr:type II toxin-antitoxin system RelE/ParE family toxin [Aggregatibacter actinomycetemcomitans]QEH47841.1 type II toxin-antitoxin system RelE/ParE family toxin [Aggregatibacter actinomycetemcomitans]
MTYKLTFDKRALKEWEKLDDTIRQQFKNKLAERLENPRVPGDKLRGYQNLYKIKLRAAGYRLVYEVNDNQIYILVLSVGKRNRLDAYKNAEFRQAR